MTTQLREGVTALGLAGVPELQERLSAYLELLSHWNQKFNLVSKASVAQALTVHVFDCLSIHSYLREGRLLDVGSGAGLPGLILAMARADVECVLIDANAKKTRFCRQVVAELHLANVEVVSTRVEDFRPSAGFETITARAYSSAEALLKQTLRLLLPGGRVLAMKACAARAELEGLGCMRDNATLACLSVPGLNAERRLLIVEKPSVCGRRPTRQQ